MPSLTAVLRGVHLIGLVLGVGCATGKLTLLLKARADHDFLPVYIAAARPLTRLIIVGLVLLTLSGVAWLIVGYPLTPHLIAKLILVAVIWALGPVIDNLVEPKFLSTAPTPGQPASMGFRQAQNRYVLLELTATGLFYAIILMWVLV